MWKLKSGTQQNSVTFSFKENNKRKLLEMRDLMESNLI